MGYVFDPAAVLSGQYLQWFLSGLGVTIMLTIAAWLTGMLVGIVLTLIRTIPFRPCEWFVMLYVGIPIGLVLIGIGIVGRKLWGRRHRAEVA